MTEPSQLLSADRAAVLADERALLSDLRVALARRARTRRSRPSPGRSGNWTSCSCWSSSASSTPARAPFVNALIGDGRPGGGRHADDRPITRASVRRRRHGDVTAAEDGVAEVTAPVDLLRDLHVVDTPGTNAVLREHEARDDRVRAPRRPGAVRHLGRPALHRERAAVPRPRPRVGQEDRLRRQQDRHPRGRAAGRRDRRLRRDNAKALLGEAPTVFAVSVRRARQGRDEPASWEASGMAAVDRFVSTTLDDAERRAAEAEEPVGDRAAPVRDAARSTSPTGSRCSGTIAQAVEQIERQLDAYRDGHGAGLRVPLGGHREGAVRDGAPRARPLRREHPAGAHQGPAEPHQGEGALRATGRGRRAPAARGEGARADRLDGERRLPAVADDHATAGGTARGPRGSRGAPADAERIPPGPRRDWWSRSGARPNASSRPTTTARKRPTSPRRHARRWRRRPPSRSAPRVSAP